MRSRWANAAIIILMLAALGYQSALIASTGFFMGDFRAFYCAARTASQGANPYHVEPLRTCESTIGPRRFFVEHPGISIPAPLPGYAIGAFVPLSLLPFGAAAAIWLLASIAAAVACVITVAKFANTAWQMAFAALMLSLGAASIPFGEVVAAALGAICISAYFAWRGNWTAASIAAAASMIEPHLGLPACLALFVWARATRIPLAISAGVLVLIAIATIGVSTNVEYFLRVLPAHALSEAARDTQFSLTSVLASFGVAPATAVEAGSLSYLVMLGVGTAVAGLLAGRLKNEAFLVCVPPAFAVLGGTFIHVTQIAVAIPAALLLVAYVRSEARTCAVLALFLLSVPWVMAWSPAFGFAPAVPLAYAAWYYWPRNIRAVMLTVLAGSVLIVGCGTIGTRLKSAPFHSYAIAKLDPSLPEASWSQFSLKSSTGSLGAWLLRIPTWTGLILLLGLLTRQVGALALDGTHSLRYLPREAP